MWNTPLYNTNKLTLELRDLIDNGVDLWDFEYPSYYKGDEKKAFEQKVIDHYRFRQIGQETVGRFKFYFKTRIREIMPRYLDLYHTVEIMHGLDNPFDNVDVIETVEDERNTTASGSSSATSTDTGNDTTTATGTVTDDKTRKFSNTPQGSIANLDKYMSEASVDNSDLNENRTSETDVTRTSEGSQSSQATNKETFKHTYTKKGNQGVNTYAHDMIEFRQSIIDVDMMIINDLNCLFLGVY